MKLRLRTFLAAALAASASLSTLAVASAAPAADKGASPIVVELEIAETAKGKSLDTLQTTLSILDDHDCATLATDRGTTHYDIKVCHQSGPPTAPVLSFEITRNLRSREAPTSQRFRVASKLPSGQRLIVGKVTQGDSATEIAARVP
jgi:hypothetical protein